MSRLVAVALLLAPAIAHAEWEITNKDANSYAFTKTCGSKTENFSIAGGTPRRYSIPAGATSCTLTLNNTSCTVRDGQACEIKSSKITNR
jgi:predicted secreted Zn-dependent protease